VGQVYQGKPRVRVSVILAAEKRHTVTGVGDLPFRGPAGNYVALRQLADIYESSGRFIVLHQGARRVQTVTCDVEGRDVISFVAKV